MKCKFIILVILFLAFSSKEIFACSCMQQEVCQFYSNAKVVFVGKVLDSTEKTRYVKHREMRIGSNKWEENTYAEKRRISRLQVVENFAGAENKKEILIETDIGSSCAMLLEKNTEYLVYANESEDEENLMTHFCSGTKQFSEAQKDLVYLRENKSNAAIVKGKVFVGDWQKFNFPVLFKNKITNVILQSDTQNFSANIGEDSSFLFSKVPFGKYKIFINLPESLQNKYPYNDAIAKELEIGDQSIIEVSERGCMVNDFLIIQKRRSQRKK